MGTDVTQREGYTYRGYRDCWFGTRTPAGAAKGVKLNLKLFLRDANLQEACLGQLVFRRALQERSLLDQSGLRLGLRRW